MNKSETIMDRIRKLEEEISINHGHLTQLLDGRKAKIIAKRAKEMNGRIGNIVAVTLRNSSVYVRLEIKSRSTPGDIVRSGAATDFYKVNGELELITEEKKDVPHVSANKAQRR